MHETKATASFGGRTSARGGGGSQLAVRCSDEIRVLLCIRYVIPRSKLAGRKMLRPHMGTGIITARSSVSGGRDVCVCCPVCIYGSGSTPSSVYTGVCSPAGVGHAKEEVNTGVFVLFACVQSYEMHTRRPRAEERFNTPALAASCVVNQPPEKDVHGKQW